MLSFWNYEFMRNKFNIMIIYSIQQMTIRNKSLNNSMHLADIFNVM
jgi:hypothetical protein